ncbi:SHOCT domain-containing protein [Pseudonocardia sp. RS11V-5]|uniref:SHOCT domain-containing protein n=1 Tax=Pseudonocardia terrae TaxID=2905831 RepID=UPI001E2FBA2C|nr:SHOCT domain-containing protein [Pseudonocardia terrae]MCE3553164.1 SHOCT domain-containing protein [Pseudonocardia terrae]
MMYWWDGHMSAWGYALMALSSVVFWALVITAIVVGVRAVRHTRTGPGPADRSTPEQLLAERYARGEIDDDEYRRRLHTLTNEFRADSRP